MQPQGIIKPKQKKNGDFFFILKRMPYCTETSDLLGIQKPLTPVQPDKAKVNVEVEKAQPVIQLDCVQPQLRSRVCALGQ